MGGFTFNCGKISTSLWDALNATWAKQYPHPTAKLFKLIRAICQKKPFQGSDCPQFGPVLSLRRHLFNAASNNGF